MAKQSKADQDMIIKVGMNSEDVENSITDLDRKMKVLDSEFKLYNETIKKTGSEQDKLALKSDYLKQKMKLQQERVKKLDDEVKKNTARYGENSAEVTKSTTRYNNARRMLARYENQLDDVTKELEKLGDGLNESGSKFDDFADKTINVTNNVGNGILAIGVLGKKMFDLGRETAETAIEISRMSQTVGMSTDTYQEWDFIMQQIGTTMEESQGDLSMLAEKALDAANGAGEGAELFGKLKVQVTDTSGKMKTQEQIFEETIVALQEMRNETERNAIASALLSGTGEKLIPILNSGTASIEELKQKAHELGLVMEEDAINKADEFSKTWIETQAKYESVMRVLGENLLPILTDALGDLVNFLQNNEYVINNFADILGITASIIGGLLQIILAVPAPVWLAIGAFIMVTKTLTIMNAIIGATSGVAAIASGALGALGITSAITGTQIMIIAGAIALVVGLLFLLSKGAKGAKKDIQDITNTASEVQNSVNKQHQNAIGRKVDGSHRSGLKRVPRDGYIAELHEDEEVLTANDPRNINNKRRDTSHGGNVENNYFITIDAKNVREINDVVKMVKKLKTTNRKGVVV